MFVQSNTVRAIRDYYRERLSGLLSDPEIRQILNHALQTRLNLDRASLMLADDQRLSESDLLYFRSIVKRLQANEPAQYIFGDTEFAGLIIRCDRRALIPRPETEELAEWAIESARQHGDRKILDLCTGTGCIALACKHHLPDAEVHALDFSKEALELAKENAGHLGLDVHFHHLDALDLTSGALAPGSYDIWISNPPYIPDADKSRMHANVLDFEPGIALFVSDADPLIFYRRIAEAAKIFLKKGGRLYFELHEDYAEKTLQLMQDTGLEDCELKLDLQGKKRMLSAVNR